MCRSPLPRFSGTTSRNFWLGTALLFRRKALSTITNDATPQYSGLACPGVAEDKLASRPV